MGDIIRIVKPIKDFGLTRKVVTQTIKNEAKEERLEFLCMVLGTLGANLLENMLEGKGFIQAGDERMSLKG